MEYGWLLEPCSAGTMFRLYQSRRSDILEQPVPDATASAVDAVTGGLRRDVCSLPEDRHDGTDGGGCDLSETM